MQIADNLIVDGTVTSTGGGNTTGNQTITGNLTVTGEIYQSAGNNLIAAGTAQGNATQLTAAYNLVGNVAAGTGVNLPASAAGISVTVINGNATTLQVYPLQGATDTINGVAAANGVALYGGSVGVFESTAAGAWTASADAGTNVAYVGNGSSANFTISPANITGGATEVDFQITAGSGNLVATLPTAAATILVMQAPSNFTSYKLRVINSSGSAGNWTLANATGWSLFGNVTIPNGTWRDFVLTVTSASGNTTSLRDVGTGTFT